MNKTIMQIGLTISLVVSIIGTITVVHNDKIINNPAPAGLGMGVLTIILAVLLAILIDQEN